MDFLWEGRHAAESFICSRKQEDTRVGQRSITHPAIGHPLRRERYWGESAMSGLNCTRLVCKGEDGWFRRPFIRTNRHNRNRAIVNSHSGSVSFAVSQTRGGLAATNAAGSLPSGP
jgi:hypothetical protein